MFSKKNVAFWRYWGILNAGKNMANIDGIIRSLQISDSEDNRRILINILGEYEQNLLGVSIGLEDGQKYLLDFIRNHPEFPSLRDDSDEIMMGY
jgi:hypothetical protein